MWGKVGVREWGWWKVMGGGVGRGVEVEKMKGDGLLRREEKKGLMEKYGEGILEKYGEKGGELGDGGMEYVMDWGVV